MKGYIGEFEELVLLTVASLQDDAYGVTIKETIEKHTDRSISLGALHSTITRSARALSTVLRAPFMFRTGAMI